MLVRSDKERTLLALVTARACSEGWYRQRLLDDTASVLREEGVRIPDGVTVAVLEDTARVKHAVVPQGAAEEQLASLRRHLPLRPGGELRLVAASPQTRFLVLPVSRAGIPYGDPELDPPTATDPTQTITEAAVVVVSETQVMDGEIQLTGYQEQQVLVAVDETVSELVVNESQVAEAAVIETAETTYIA